MNFDLQIPMRTDLGFRNLYHSPIPHSQASDTNSFSNPRISSRNLDYEIDSNESATKNQISEVDEVESPGLETPRNVCTSFDIYGNELVDLNNVSPFEPNEDLKPQKTPNYDSDDADDPLSENKENNDPVMNMVTPLKKRNNGSLNSLSQSSYRMMARSPLIDITPPLVRKRPGTKKKIQVRFVLKRLS